MAALALAALFLAMIGGSEATWCVCKPEMVDTALQKTLDYACGAGADCNPILQNGACYSPNTVRSHCSYATNSYYQRKGQAQGACDFTGTATLTTTDPSYSGCTYPATQSAAGSSSTPSTSAPGTSTPTSFTPSTGGLGGLGPSTGISSDTNHGGLVLEPGIGALLFAATGTCMALLSRAKL
ncbi:PLASMODESMATA CALLOSE-BINDING PROTEIN 2-like [Curcuma longa]|uniref:PLASMODESMATA CALLOSE-BINDING PROTEIN 2-like n=1 Tax=Curcuma longa TaxID=136217 RepID=UPI003D9FA776